MSPPSLPEMTLPTLTNDHSPSTSDTHTDDDELAIITDNDADSLSNSDSSSPQTHFHLTGFKQFYNVPVNPTELIVNALPQYLEDHPLRSCAHLSSTNVFEVAAKTTLRGINTLYARHAYAETQKERPYRYQSRGPQQHTVFVHLGVNMSISNFHLETQARNEATFSCPDQLGWTPIRHAIDADDSDITLTRKTSLDLPTMVKRLQADRFPVDISNNAGRFVCNWIYYNSLKLSKENNTNALFVHVPSAAVIPLQRQVEFIAALLDTIAVCPAV